MKLYFRIDYNILYEIYNIGIFIIIKYKEQSIVENDKIQQSSKLMYIYFDNTIYFQKMEQSKKKLDFLVKQNKQLKQQIIQLKDLIKVNKESIDILSFFKAQKNEINLDNTIYYNSIKDDHKKLLEVIKRLNNKNTDLTQSLFKVQQQKQQLNSRILVLEQITEENKNNERKTIEQMQSNIKNLNETLITTENKLRQSQKIQSQLDSMTGLVIKYKQIHSATEQTLKFQLRQSQLSQEILILKEQVKQLKQQKQNLISINVNLKNQIIKLKATMLMPNRSLDRMGQTSIKRLALYFLEAQRRILRGEDSDSDYEDDIQFIAPELLVLFPDKVEKIKSKKEKPLIPTLNLLKTRQLMVSNQKKIQAQLRRRNNMTKSERISKLQQQLDFTRKQLTRTMLQLKEMEDKYSKIERQSNQFQNRNRILVQAYQSIEKKIRNIKLSYRKYQQNTEQNKDSNISFLNFSFIDRYLFTQPSPKQQIVTAKTNKNYQLLLSGKQQFQIQANNLAHQVSKLPHLKDIAKIPFKIKKIQEPHIKRSYSNPLLYVQQRKHLIYNKINKNPNHENRQNCAPKKLQETCFVRVERTADNQNRKYQEDLQNIPL